MVRELKSSNSYKISILRGSGKRKLLTGTPRWNDPKQRRQTMLFPSRRAAQNFIDNLHPDTIREHKPHIIKPPKRKR